MSSFESLADTPRPHRAGTLYACSILGLILLGFGLPFSICARIFARRDLESMQKGRMDASGNRLCRRAWRIAFVGTWINIIFFLISLVLFVVMMAYMFMASVFSAAWQ